MKRMVGFFVLIAAIHSPIQADEPKPVKDGPPLPNTKQLSMQGDIAMQLVEGVDKFLLKEIDKSVERRARHWKRDFSSPEAYNKSIEPNRKRLAHILGIRDSRVPFDAPELVATTNQPALVGKGENYEIFAVRWPAFGDVHGEGLLLVPTSKKPVANVVAIPDADQTPEQIVGLVEGVPAESQFARRLAESGCRVIVPTLIDRKLEKRNGRANLTSREYLYRSAFELGRTLIGYEVQKVLAAVDWFEKDSGKNRAKIGVAGYGEGGLLALYSGAIDIRIDALFVSGYFDDRQNIWREPIDRNVFGLLEQFGDGELYTLIFPRRSACLDASKGPNVSFPSQGGAPARLVSPLEENFVNEVRRGSRQMQEIKGDTESKIVAVIRKGMIIESGTSIENLLTFLSPDTKLVPTGTSPSKVPQHFDPVPRQLRQQHEIDRHNQYLLGESHNVRREFMKNLVDMSQSGNPVESLDKYQDTAKEYRKIFYEQVIGKFDYDLLPMNPRSRKAYEAEKWTGYEVVLDVFPDVIAYGILLLPKDLKEGEKRPVVVCQHGLEGKPQHVIGKEGYGAYKAFAAELANRGYITFAPQNLYIGHDKFRTLQRKANPLGKTLFSIIVPQHQQIINWLKTQPNVDTERIAFYGLSYGGKTAMRVPAILTDYCLSICSADFGEWVWKCASTKSPYSYVWTGEYEIFEWDLGSTFNYAEMSALIAPRPFMVERGHFDGVEPDEAVGHEFARVQFLYDARLKLPDRCAIDWFDGPHTINGKGTFEFLAKHLKWKEK
jgi:dienelactone hydrolase